nr:hypothetical protein [Tanacetum cinerariifolium]
MCNDPNLVIAISEATQVRANTYAGCSVSSTIGVPLRFKRSADVIIADLIAAELITVPLNNNAATGVPVELMSNVEVNVRAKQEQRTINARGSQNYEGMVDPSHQKLKQMPGENKVDERVFPTVMDWRTNAPKDGMPAVSTYSIEAVRALDTHRTPIQKQPEMLLCLVEISRRYYLGDEVYPTFLHDDDRDMDLFNLIRASNPTKVKTGSRPRAPHEVPLLTLTATRVIEIDDPATATDSSGVPSTIEKSPLDFADEAGVSDQGTVALEMPPSEDVPATDAAGAGQAEEVVATDPPTATESRKRGRDGTDGNAPPKSLRRDHADPRPTGSFHGGKSLAAIQLGLASTVFVPENAPAGVSDPDPLFFSDPPSRHPADVPQSS